MPLLREERAEDLDDRRDLPGQDAAALFAEVERRAVAALPELRGVVVKFEPHETDEALATSEGAPLVQWLVDRTASQTISVPFYTEGPTFSRMGAVACICGPGEIAQAHREDEWVEMDALEAASDLYADAIEAFCT